MLGTMVMFVLCVVQIKMLKIAPVVTCSIAQSPLTHTLPPIV